MKIKVLLAALLTTLVAITGSYAIPVDGIEMLLTISALALASGLVLLFIVRFTSAWVDPIGKSLIGRAQPTCCLVCLVIGGLANSKSILLAALFFTASHFVWKKMYSLTWDSLEQAFPTAGRLKRNKVRSFAVQHVVTSACFAAAMAMQSRSAWIWTCVGAFIVYACSAAYNPKREEQA
jgi:hypothetical protein